MLLTSKGATWQTPSSSSTGRINVADYGAVADGVLYPGGTATTSSTTFTDTLNRFTPAMVGKVISIRGTSVVTWGVCRVHTTTIAAYVNAGEITLTTAPPAEPTFPSWAGVNPAHYTGTFFYIGTDNTAAFSAAAQAAPSQFSTQPSKVEHAPLSIVDVPAGTYLLLNSVDTGGRHVIWNMQTGAVCAAIDNLTGRIESAGTKVGGRHHGTHDYSCSFAVLTGNLEYPLQGAGVSCYTDPAQLSLYASRDSVGFYTQNTAQPPSITVASATFTATTMIPATPLTTEQVKLLRKGMIIDTGHTTKYSGLITGWAGNGASVTVSAWYLSSGVLAGPSTPPGSYTCYVNPQTSIWGHNTNVIMPSDGYATQMQGYELGLANNKLDAAMCLGFDVVQFGAYKPTSAFSARTAVSVGYANVFTAYAPSDYAFVSDGATTRAFYSKGSCTHHFYSTNFNVLGSTGAITSSASITAPIHYSGAVSWRSGAGTPEGVVAAPVGSLFTRTDGGTSTTLYVKESGASNTGWVAK